MGYKKRTEPERLAWHFLPSDRRLTNDDRRLVKVGQTLEMLPNERYPKPTLCQSGMHGSIRPLDALRYAPGPVACRVSIWGDVQSDEDKITGRYRKVLAMSDVSDALRLFARQCALDVVHLWNAPSIVCEYLAGDESKRDATWAAARAAQNERLEQILSDVLGVKI